MYICYTHFSMQLLQNTMNSVTLTKSKTAGPLQINDSISKMNKEKNFFSKTQNLTNDSLKPGNFDEERESVSNDKLSAIDEQIIIGNKKDYQRTLEPHKSKKPLPSIRTTNTGQTSKTSFQKIDSSLDEKSPNLNTGNNNSFVLKYYIFLVITRPFSSIFTRTYFLTIPLKISESS